MLGLNQVNPYPLHAIAEIEHSGCAIAQIHDPVAYIRTAVIDPNNDPLAIFKVCHLYKASQRELPVSGCELKHIKVLAAGCGLAMELLAVPGSASYLIGFLFNFCTLLRFWCCFDCFCGHGDGAGFYLGLLVVWNCSRPHVG